MSINGSRVYIRNSSSMGTGSIFRTTSEFSWRRYLYRRRNPPDQQFAVSTTTEPAMSAALSTPWLVERSLSTPTVDIVIPIQVSPGIEHSSIPPFRFHL